MEEYMTIKNGEPYKIKYIGEEAIVELNNYIPFDLTFDIRFVDMELMMERKLRDFDDEDDDEFDEFDDFEEEDDIDLFYDVEEMYYLISDETPEYISNKIHNFYPFVTATLFNNSTDELVEIFDDNIMAVLTYINMEMNVLFKTYSINLQEEFEKSLKNFYEIDSTDKFYKYMSKFDSVVNKIFEKLNSNRIILNRVVSSFYVPLIIPAHRMGVKKFYTNKFNITAEEMFNSSKTYLFKTNYGATYFFPQGLS